MLAWAVSLSSALTFLVPPVARLGVRYVCALRALAGAAEAASLPATYDIIALWFPVAEKSTAVGLAAGANFIGSILGFGNLKYLISTHLTSSLSSHL